MAVVNQQTRTASPLPEGALSGPVRVRRYPEVCGASSLALGYGPEVLQDRALATVGLASPPERARTPFAGDAHPGILQKANGTQS